MQRAVYHVEMKSVVSGKLCAIRANKCILYVMSVSRLASGVCLARWDELLLYGQGVSCHEGDVS